MAKREISFRGKTVDGVWVYGYVEIFRNALGKSKAVIHSFSDWNLNMRHEVDIDSVGESTGLKDKNGKEIYEGDIVEFLKEPKYKRRWRVLFQDGSFGLTDGIGVRFLLNQSRKDENDNNYPPVKESEIIGNIYENPELISVDN